jgi:hypothetical protein
MSDMSTNLSSSSHQDLIHNKPSSIKDNRNVQVVRISESVELPISVGILEVDTSKGAITIFMNSRPRHSETDYLTIKKVSHDNNMVSLFSETSLINNAEIVMFGLPVYAKVKKGKVKVIVLKSDGSNWKIIHEE